MSLSDLPDKILGLISFWLNGFDNCFLWMASDPKLQHRLVNNVITDFHIKYTIPGRYLWPGSFLKKLVRLSHLSLVVDEEMYHIPIENMKMSRIETLKSLRLHCNNPLEDSAALPSERFAYCLFSEFGSSNIYLHHLYPNLDHLDILYPTYSDANLKIFFVRILPKHLKTLQIHLRADESNITTYVGLLPKTLTELTLRVSSYGFQPYFDAGHLPPNLVSLSTNAIILEKSYHNLPENLTMLDSLYTEYNLQKLWQFLPIGLRALKLLSSCRIGYSLAHLNHLEHFELGSSSDDQIFMTKYPPNLKYCHGYFAGSQEMTILPFAHGLVELHLVIGKGFDSDFFSKLPQTLTVLLLYSRESPEPFEFFTLLPKHLKSLDTNLPVIENLSLLPDTMTNLVLITDYDVLVDRLPPKLEILNLVGFKIPNSVLIQLPEHLKSLNLQSEDILVDDEVISSLPRSLTNLSLKTLLNITDASASLFPPNLKSLTLLGDDNMADSAIAQLPRSLTHLDLSQNYKLTDKCIKDLPRNLINLDLSNCIEITPKCCKDLPNNLRLLKIPNSTEWILDLPKFVSVHSS